MRFVTVLALLTLTLSTAATAQEPWLPAASQQYVKALWPEGVPFPVTLKFYALPKASQVLKTTNNQPYYGFHSVTGFDNINTEFPDLTVPAASLNAFVGKSINGNWSLKIQDLGPADLGTLNTWTLSLTAQ